MKRYLSLLAVVVAVLCCVAVVFPVPANADMGPKPSVQLTFNNLSDEVCYCTLLSKTATTGPHSVWDGDEDHIGTWTNLNEDIWWAFVNYRDADGFYFLQYAKECGQSKSFSWDYYPPETFKVLLYWPQTGKFVSSDILETYAFNSYFTVEMDGVNIGSVSSAGNLPVEQSYNYGKEVLMFFVRLLLTVALELGLAWLFRLREKKVFLLLVFANIGTQVILNVLISVLSFFSGPLAVLLLYLPLELLVFVIELVLYLVLIPKLATEKVHKGKIVLYTFLANLLSFGVGLVLALFLPEIF